MSETLGKWSQNEDIARRIGYDNGNDVDYAASINERHEDLPEFLELLQTHVTEEHHGRVLFDLLLANGIGTVRGLMEAITRDDETENTASRETGYYHAAAYVAKLIGAGDAQEVLDRVAASEH